MTDVTDNCGHVLIVGAGVTGLVTAVRCLIAGHRVTLIDRDDIPSPMSTSFDEHRVIRALDPSSATMSADVFSMHRLWSELETLLCGPDPDCGFYDKVGAVSVWNDDTIDLVVSTAAAARIPIEPVDTADLCHIRLDDGARAVREIDAGVLLADRTLLALTRYLMGHPRAHLLPRRGVTAVDIDSTSVRLTGEATVSADVVLVAAGPWSTSLIDVQTTLLRQTMVYLDPPECLAAWWRSTSAIGRLGHDHRGWLVPPVRGTSLKMSTDNVCRKIIDLTVDDGPPVDWAATVLAAMPIVDIDTYALTAVKQCHYAVDAATGGASLIRLSPTVWARAASGGDGFRTAPTVADPILDYFRPPMRPNGRNN